MGVDLKAAGLMGRTSLLAQDEAVVILEHVGLSDRIHKIMYENIESIIIWRKTPWLKMGLTFLLMAPLIYFTYTGYEGGFFENQEQMIPMAIALAILIVVEGIFLLRKNICLRINHGGEVYEIKFPAFPWTVARFVRKVKEKAEATQARLREKRDSARPLP